MFEPGDKIVHTRHGAGTVIEERAITFEGQERQYFCIRLNDGNQTVMIPVENVDEEELRPAIDDFSVIEEVMNSLPNELDDNYRTRQAGIKAKLRTRNPRKLAQALRDLCWLEYTHKLTTTDSRLRDRLIKALARELSLKPRITLLAARNRLQRIIEQAMHRHLERAEAVTTPA